MNRLAAAAVLALLLLPCVEIGTHFAARARVPERSDWRQAADFVRGELAERDLIASAPGWTDPLLREAIGDRIDAAMAGRSDTAPYERLWSLSIRGARPSDAPSGAPELEKRFGAVTVQRWSLGRSPVVFDAVRAIAAGTAQVAISHGTETCAERRLDLARGGGLGYGVLPPRTRYACGKGGELWSAPVVLEELSLAPRHCMRVPPLKKPLRVELRDVALGDRIVVYGGLYYEHERMRRGAPVDLRVELDGRELARMHHADGDGWKRLEVATPAGATNARGTLAIEVQSSAGGQRHFCWSATTRRGPDHAEGAR